MSITGLKRPVKSCEDRNCPYHGTLSVRGRFLDGIVVTSKMSQTAVVERNYLHYVSKYMRYEKRRSRLMAHNPACLEVRDGDRVRIGECRPISKEVSFVIIGKLES